MVMVLAARLARDRASKRFLFDAQIARFADGDPIRWCRLTHV